MMLEIVVKPVVQNVLMPVEIIAIHLSISLSIQHPQELMIENFGVVSNPDNLNELICQALKSCQQAISHRHRH